MSDLVVLESSTIPILLRDEGRYHILRILSQNESKVEHQGTRLTTSDSLRFWMMLT